MEIYKGKTVLVTGAHGFLGKHVTRQLLNEGAEVMPWMADLLPDPISIPVYRTPKKDLLDIDLVIHLAAKVGGAKPNRENPWRFLRNNTMMELHAIDLALWMEVPLVAAGSVCAYPAETPIPFQEHQFWEGKPEANNLGYGLAKRWLSGALECAGIQQGLRYAHLISANLYGPGDPGGENGHVIPGLIQRMEAARLADEPTVDVWGSGAPSRDFLYVEDAASAYVMAGAHLLRGGDPIECNIGSGYETTIAYVAAEIKRCLGYEGKVVYDRSKPDGQMQRRVDSSLAQKVLRWQSFTSLRNGLIKTIEWFRGREAT